VIKFEHISIAMAAEGVFSSEDKSQHKDEVVRARRKMNESGIMERYV
jgi:hypothetical protein